MSKTWSWELGAHGGVANLDALIKWAWSNITIRPRGKAWTFYLECVIPLARIYLLLLLSTNSEDFQLVTIISNSANLLVLLQDFFPTVPLPAPPTCSGCGLDMALLVQMYCPLEASPYHRTFHVYCCCSLACTKTNRYMYM